MRNALLSVPGVRQVIVNFEAQEVVVEAAKPCDTGPMLAALKRDGYGGTVK